jgi:hypothetical protein
MNNDENFFQKASENLKKIENSEVYKSKKEIGKKRAILFIVLFFPVALMFLLFKWNAVILVAYMLISNVAIYFLVPRFFK